MVHSGMCALSKHRQLAYLPPPPFSLRYLPLPNPLTPLSPPPPPPHTHGEPQIPAVGLRRLHPFGKGAGKQGLECSCPLLAPPPNPLSPSQAPTHYPSRLPLPPRLPSLFFQLPAARVSGAVGPAKSVDYGLGTGRHWHWEWGGRGGGGGFSAGQLSSAAEWRKVRA